MLICTYDGGLVINSPHFVVELLRLRKEVLLCCLYNIVAIKNTCHLYQVHIKLSMHIYMYVFSHLCYVHKL